MPEDLHNTHLSVNGIGEDKAEGSLFLPVSNEADVLALERNAVVPVGRVQKRALVLIKTRNGGPFPVIKNARGVDKDIAS